MGEEATSGAGPVVCVGRFEQLEDALCERVRELRDGDPLRPLTILVGSAAVRTRVGDVLVRRLGAVANVRIVTLARHAADVVARVHGAPPVVLTGLARERLLRHLVAARARTGLAYFGPVWERPHFARALRATCDDLRQALVDPASSWAAAFGAGTGVARDAAQTPVSAARADDLSALYAAYCGRLEHIGGLDEAGVFRLAADLAAAEGGAGGVTLVYGLYDLNSAQEAFVLALPGAELFVPVPRDGLREHATALTVARAGGARERLLDASPASRDVDRLSALWRPTASPTPATGSTLTLAGDGSLAVVSVPDERAETREAVRAVLEALTAGASAWDCAVVVPHAADAERYAAALREAGLPAACHPPDRSQGPKVLSRLVDCLAPVAGPPFSRRAVVDLLAAAPLAAASADPGVVALWADEARQAGIVAGPHQWSERLGRRRRGLERRVVDLEQRSGAATDDDGDAERLAVVRQRRDAARSLEIAWASLEWAAGALPERCSWGAWAGALGTVADAVFDAGVAAAVRDAAGRLQALQLLDEEVDVAEMAAVLREQLDGATAPVGRVGRDGVAVLTPLQSRGLAFHTVVFTGLAEGGFPPRGRPDPLLGDAERRRIMAATGVRLPLAEERDAESLVLFAFAAEAARVRLDLLAPRTDAATGRPRLPSRLLLRLASLCRGRAVGLDDFLTGAPLAPVWRRVGGDAPSSDAAAWVDVRERDTATLLALSARGRRAARAYVATALGDASVTERRLGAWHAARSPEPGAWDGLLGAPARAALVARHPFDVEMHPTRLERYIDCPFAFLLRDVFELAAPEEPGDALEMTPLEAGTLTHAVLQRTFEAVIADGRDLAGALEALEVAWAAGCADAERRGVTGAALSWEVRRDILRDDLREALHLDPVFRDDGRPVAVEWRFGAESGRPVVVDGLEGGRTVRFAGRIDRIDATAVGARVVDYKTGAGATERARIKEGLSVQLPVYGLAVRTHARGLDLPGPFGGADEEPVAVTSMYRLVTRRGGFADVPLSGEEVETGARLRELVAATVALVDAGAFPRSARGRCDFCDVRYACGVSAWARARKRRHEALAPVVALQQPRKGGRGGD